MDLSSQAPHLVSWSGTIGILLIVIALRQIRRFGFPYQDLLNSLFIFVWMSFVLIRLNLYFFAEAKLPFNTLTWIAIAGSALWAVPLFFLRESWRRWYGIAVVLMAMGLVIVDIYYFRLSGSLGSFKFNPSMIRDISIGPLASLLAETVVVGVALPTPNRSKFSARAFRKIGLFSLLTISVMIGTWFYWGFQQLYDMPAESSEAGFIRRGGLWNYHFFLFMRDFDEWRERHPLSHAREVGLLRVKDAIEEYRQANEKHRHPFGVARGMNVILVQADSLREFLIGSRVMGQEVTPFLDSLRKNGLYFTQVYSQVNDGGPLDAQFITLTSLHPLSRGSVALRKRHESFIALPQILNKHNYYTFASRPSFGWSGNDLSMHKRYGFQESQFLEDMDEVRPPEQTRNGMADEAFVERMVPKLKSLPRPFFAFLRTMGGDPQLRRPLPDHINYLELGPMENTSLGIYLQGVREVDYALEGLVKSIRESDLKNNTLIVIYGYPQTALAATPELQAFLKIQKWNPAAELNFPRIPLFILLPHGSMHGAVNTMGGHIDIAPTLLSLLGIDPSPTFLGHVLLDSESHVVAFQNGKVLSPKLVFSPKDLETSEDDICFVLPAASTVTVTNCDGLREKARQQLATSDLIHQFNFAEDIQSLFETRKLK